MLFVISPSREKGRCLRRYLRAGVQIEQRASLLELFVNRFASSAIGKPLEVVRIHQRNACRAAANSASTPEAARRISCSVGGVLPL